MKQKKKVLLIFLTILLAVIIVKMLKYYPEYTKFIEKNNIIGNNKVVWNLIWIGGLILTGIMATMIPGIVVWIIYKGDSNVYKLSKKEALENKLDRLDLGKYEGYYRDIISEYSPAVLSFIDDFESNTPKDRVAALLNLKLKKYVDVKNGKIEVLNKDFSKLTESERYLLENEEFNDFEFESKVKQEAIKSGLITPRKIDLKKYVIGIVVAIILPYIGGITLFQTINGSGIASRISFIPVIIFCICIFFSFFLILYNLNCITIFLRYGYLRTKKGREVNKKLKGLKKYLKDFSNLNEKCFNDVILWEDYLIYSVIFEQNKKIISEIIDE